MFELRLEVKGRKWESEGKHRDLSVAVERLRFIQGDELWADLWRGKCWCLEARKLKPAPTILHLM